MDQTDADQLLHSNILFKKLRASRAAFSFCFLQHTWCRNTKTVCTIDEIDQIKRVFDVGKKEAELFTHNLIGTRHMTG
jgi:hypothetical protein